MNFSYWEQTRLIGQTDVIIIGSGITGLSTAIHLKKAKPELKVKILERGVLPWGASSKNAGFACFGSLGEIISDLEHTRLEEIVELIKFRKEGLELITSLLGEKNMDLQVLGGYELFQASQKEEYEVAIDRMAEFNALLHSEFGGDVYTNHENTFGFQHILGVIKNNFEGQIDTGMMMQAYLKLAKSYDIEILNGAEVEEINDLGNQVSLKLKGGPELKTSQVIVCSNGFAKQFLKEDVEPARAQVLITKPIEDLPFKGTFHYDQGYYYFRNIHNRVLFGGGRNLDLKGENTTEMECSDIIMNKLKSLLDEVVLPNTKYEIDYNWAGVMGVGEQKIPIIKKISTNVSCAVRLGGMGVAVGTTVGKKAAEQYLCK